jgi:hypothetical protein
MANWFVYDKSGVKNGPFSSVQLKGLVDSHKITPETILETEDGRRGKAGQMKGLFSAEKASPTGPTVSHPSSDEQTEESLHVQGWHFYDANGVKQGPFSDEQIKSLADSGDINENTELEIFEGHWVQAGSIEEFFPNTQEEEPEIDTVHNGISDPTILTKQNSGFMLFAILIIAIVLLLIFHLMREGV